MWTNFLVLIVFDVYLEVCKGTQDTEQSNSNSGRYTVKEEVQKAPEANYFCNLTRTSVKISFPEMKSRVFVNFLGYKEPNLIHLQRCKGKCGDSDNSIACVPLRTKETKVKMMLKSYLTGPDQVPDERVREMVLEEHLECGCACDEFAPYQCLGKFNKTTCQCDCTPEEFGQAKEFCESQLDFHWSYETCECVKRSLVERGAGEEPRSYNNCGDYFSLLARRGNSILDIGGWVLLGSCLALVAILAGATYHYRKKLRILQGKEKRKQCKRINNSSQNKTGKSKRKTFFHDRENSKYYNNSADCNGAVSHGGGGGNMTKMPSLTQLERIAIENSLLLSGTGGGQLYHEQYDEHGVKIEYQCFK